MIRLILVLALVSLACGQIVTPIAELPVSESPTIAPTPDFAPVPIIPVIVADLVTVEYEHVNLRNPDGSASGITVSKGQVLAVEFQDSGWAVVTDGPHKDLLIWQGCTSIPGEFGCEAE